MATGPQPATAPGRVLFWKLVTSAAVISIAAACSPFSKSKTPKLEITSPKYDKQPKQVLRPKNPLHIATTYWANAYQKNPGDAKAALNYAKNLKAIGASERALAVLKRAHRLHPSHRQIASEYGRLALKQGQTKVALKALVRAHRARGKTDWRVLSAQGTAYAKLGKHAEAQRYFTAALGKKPDEASLLNNLALSHAMSGNPRKAEKLLRQAMADGEETPRIRQNLALVLGLQRKFGEARQVASVDLSDKKAKTNMAYLRSMVSERKLAKADADRTPVHTASLPVPMPNRKPQRAIAKAEKPMALQPAHRASASAAPAKVKAKRLTPRTAPLPWAKPERVKPAKAQPTATAAAIPLPTRRPAAAALSVRQQPSPKTTTVAATSAVTNSVGPTAAPASQTAGETPEAIALSTAWLTRVERSRKSTPYAHPSDPFE